MSEVTLPSGLRGIIRELSIEEENVLSNPKLSRRGKNIIQVFKNCWVETLDRGIYTFEEFDPTVLLQGDAMVLLVLLRIESHGSDFAFEVNCPSCGRKIGWQIDLNEFVEVNRQDLTNQAKKVLIEENGVFKGHFPKCDRDFTFRLLTFRDEQSFPEIQARASERLSSEITNMSIRSIDGVQNKAAFLGCTDRPGPEGLLSSADANAFREIQDEVNCGLFTDFEVECPQDGEVTVELPFSAEFFFPKQKRSRRRASRKRQMETSPSSASTSEESSGGKP